MLPATFGANQFKHRATATDAVWASAEIRRPIEISGSVGNQIGKRVCPVGASGKSIDDFLLAGWGCAGGGEREQTDDR
jgi:hypothetical protein